MLQLKGGCNYPPLLKGGVVTTPPLLSTNTLQLPHYNQVLRWVHQSRDPLHGIRASKRPGYSGPRDSGSRDSGSRDNGSRGARWSGARLCKARLCEARRCVCDVGECNAGRKCHDPGATTQCKTRWDGGRRLRARRRTARRRTARWSGHNGGVIKGADTVIATCRPRLCPRLVGNVPFRNGKCGA